MAGFNFRIGTKLGLTAGIGVLLVGGMLASEMLGNHAIATSSGMVITNFQNRGNAQTANLAMARAELATAEIGHARTETHVDTLLQTFRENLTGAAVQIDAATKRATREVVKDAYRDLKTFVEAYQITGTELATAQKVVVAATIAGRQANDAWNGA